MHRRPSSRRRGLLPSGATASLATVATVVMALCAAGSASAGPTRLTSTATTVAPATVAPATVVPAAAGIVGSIRPERLYDSRTDTPLNPGEDRSVCDNTPSVPNDAAALVVNLTAVSPTAAGYLTASALSDDAPPVVSTLNFTPGTTTSNLAIVPLGLVGCIQVHNGSTGKTHVLVDVQGYLSAGPATVNGSTQTIYPSRILDTRTKRVAIPAHSSLDVQVAGAGGLPPTNVAAAWLNLTVTGNARAGYLTAYPTGTTQPLAANLNFGAGETRAAGTLAKVGLNGRVTVYNGSSAPAHLVVDAQGFVRSGSGASALAGVTPVAPTRLVDTRTSEPVAPGTPLTVGLNSATRPTNSAAAVVAVTATDATAPGYLRVSSSQVGDNSTSMVNFVPGRATTNLVVARTIQDLVIANGSSQAVHVVVDVVGWVNPERAISGTVTSTQGAPLNKSPVYGSTGTSPLLAYSGADGRYSASLPPSATSTLVCAGSPIVNSMPTYDYASDCYGSWSNPDRVTLRLGESATGVDVALQPAGVLRGTATDTSGGKLTSGQVWIYRLDTTRIFRTTISDGTWFLRGVPAGQNYLSLAGPGSALATPFGLAREWYPDVQPGPITTAALMRDAGAEALDVTAGATTTTDLVAEPLARLSGTLSNPDGTPVTAQTGIRLRRPNGSVWVDSSSSVESPATWARFAHPGATTACAYRRLAEPQVCWKGNVPPDEATPITLAPGEDRTGIAITLP
ncbi:hypothetical protein EAH86_03185 [Pedococcus bigeumensis]|uniref:Carboxypeptidase regulatory-like domain-containing protein n=1 Tax=Pedococcus bigeumensis TaxID=433644 RepID=A0A502D656_9MICO|nr:hypothetical protein EAH86_03185 [Pedococcus bigeumensis]